MKRDEIDDTLDSKQGINLDDLDDEDASAFENDDTVEQLEDEENDGTEGEELEDYFASAEFTIWVIELIMVWGMNFYLKRLELDAIGIEEFKKTKEEQKFLVKTWARVLQKHNAKVSPEMELLFSMGSAYIMKMRNIVEAQRLRKMKQEMEAKRDGTKPPPQKTGKDTYDITKYQKDGTKKEKTDNKFDVDVENIEEVADEGVGDLITEK